MIRALRRTLRAGRGRARIFLPLLSVGLLLSQAAEAQRTTELRARRVDDGDRVRMQGDLVRADEALAALAYAMDWNLRIDPRGTGLGRRLSDELIDLAIEDDARQVARWIGFAVDAQVVLAERMLPNGITTELVVRPLPSPETEGGRQRSLSLAVEELRAWLQAYDSDTLFGPQTATGRAVRIALGPLERRLGRPEAGAEHLAEVVYAPTDHSELEHRRQAQLIELALCWFDAGPDPDYDVECDRALREALRVDPNSYEAARAAELLARLLYRRGDDEACLAEVPALIGQYRWEAFDEPVLDAHLTVGHAALRLGDLASAQIALRDVHSRLGGRRPTGQRSVELAGLEGALSYQINDYDRVVIQLSRFLAGLPDGDARLDGARLLLADSCLRTGRYAQAYRLARSAFADRGRLRESDYTWAAELYLEAARSVGLAGEALRELQLEVQVRSIQRLRLLLFVVDELVSAESLEAARNLLVPVVRLPGPTGDPARVRMIEILLAQARAAGDPKMPRSAARLLVEIGEDQLRHRALRAFADYFVHFGHHDRAAAVWQGVLP